jgi:cytochrome c553
MADYALAQLYVFRENQRVAAPMNDMAAGLSDEDLQALSAAIAKFPPPEPAAATLSAAEVAQAAELIGRYRCNSCHGPTLAGAGQIPRLAGQREDYLLKSLVEYKSNARIGYNPAMNEVSQEVKSEDIPMLAKFISQYR